MDVFYSQVLVVLFFACINSMLSLFLDYCIEEGNIFDFYSKWLDKELGSSWFYKPLGGCVICANVWIAFVTFVVVFSIFNIHLGWFIPYALISNTFLRLLIRINY